MITKISKIKFFKNSFKYFFENNKIKIIIYTLIFMLLFSFFFFGFGNTMITLLFIMLTYTSITDETDEGPHYVF